MFNLNKLNLDRIKVENEVKELLKEHQRVAVVRPCSWGKSYLIMKLCDFYKGKKLILEPTNILKKYLKQSGKNFNTDIIINTYQSLLHKSVDEIKEIYKDLQFIFLDEMHRCGAKKWKKALEKLFKAFPDAKVIGMSATPIRNDLNNIIETMFNGIQVEPLYLGEAIQQGLLPNVCYVASLYAISKDYNDLLKAIHQAKNIGKEKKSLLVNKLNQSFLNYKEVKNVPNILQKYLFKETYHLHNMKFVVFCKNIDSIEQSKKMIEQWFYDCYKDSGIKKEIKFYEVHSRNKKFENENAVSLFEETHHDNVIDIIMSVNMFNEGYHLDKLTGIILLRETKSNIVYFQQIGRGISQTNEIGIILDLVNNCNSIQTGYIKLFSQQSINTYKINNENKAPENNFVVNIHDETKDIVNIIEEINEVCFGKAKRLTNKEIEYILKNYKDKTAPEIAKHLERGVDTIRKFCKDNNIICKKSKFHSTPLSLEEQQYIRDNVKNKNYVQIAEDIGRKKETISDFCKRNNIEYISIRNRNGNNSYNNLSQEIKNYIKKNAKSQSASEMAKKFSISRDVVRNFCRKNDIVCLKNKSRLSTLEKDYILNNYQHKSQKEIAKELHRSEGTIKNFYKKNNLIIETKIICNNSLSDDDKKYIKENAKTQTIKMLSNTLNKDESMIRNFCKQNDIEWFNKLQKLTNSDKKFIIENISKLSMRKISEQLGRSYFLIVNFCHKENLNYNKGDKIYNPPLSDEEKKYIKKAAKENTTTEIAKKLGRSSQTIAKFCKKENIIIKKKAIKHRLSESDKSYIRENAYKQGLTEIAKDLKQPRTLIKHFCERYNIRYLKVQEQHLLTNDEKQYIIDNQDVSIRELANKLNVNTDSIRRYLTKEGIFIKKQFPRLTDDEKQYIINNINKISIKNIAKEINRSPSTIRDFCKKNNIDYLKKKNFELTDNEKQYILKNYKDKNISNIAKDLKRSRNTISKFFVENNIQQNKKNLSEEDKEYIRKNILRQTVKEISNTLQQSIYQINKFCIEENLSKKQSKLTDDEKQYIIDNADKMSQIQISKNLGRHINTIQRFLSKRR